MDRLVPLGDLIIDSTAAGDVLGNKQAELTRDLLGHNSIHSLPVDDVKQSAVRSIDLAIVK